MTGREGDAAAPRDAIDPGPKRMADANHVYNAGRARRIQVVLACLLAISYAPALSLGIRDPVYLK